MPTDSPNSFGQNDSDGGAVPPFARLLKFWRGVYRLSQEELAHRLDSSPRHISRLENGRVHPSKAMVESISSKLSMGERDSSHLLIAAGFSPRFKKVDFNSPDLRWLRKAMTLTLRALDPYPATLTDGASNILMVNRGWVGLYGAVVPPDKLARVTNHFDFLFSGQGVGGEMRGWEDTLSVILMSLQQGVLLTDDEQNQAMLDRLQASRNVPEDWQQRAAALEPMASYRVQVEFEGTPRRFFSVSQTVGAMGPSAYVSEPQLTVNTLYPEDENLDLSKVVEGTLSHPLLSY